MFHRLSPFVLPLLLLLPVTGFTELTGNIGVTSNYVFRGFTQTDDAGALQGGVDYKTDFAFFAGAWASNVDCTAANPCFNNPGVTADGFEINVYAGFSLEFENDFGFEVGVISYEYSDSALDANREAFIGVSFRGAGLTYYAGNDTSTNAPGYEYLDFKLAIPLQEETDLNLHYGRYEADNSTTEINDFSIGVSKKVLGADVSLTITSEDATDEEELFFNIMFVFGDDG